MSALKGAQRSYEVSILTLSDVRELNVALRKEASLASFLHRGEVSLLQNCATVRTDQLIWYVCLVSISGVTVVIIADSDWSTIAQRVTVFSAASI